MSHRLPEMKYYPLKIQKRRILYHTALTIVFFLIISLPGVVWLASWDSISVSLAEKRSLTKIPVITMEKKSLQEFPQKFEAYFNDHFGFRDKLIHIHNYATFFFLNRSPMDAAIMGKQHWLFYTRNKTLENHRGLLPFNQQELDNWRRTLGEREKYLASNGVKYLFVIAPDKESIYKEMLPDYLTVANNETRLDQLIGYLNNSTMKLIDLRKPLLEEKKKIQYPLYSIYGTHWNNYGAYIAYRRIIEEIQKWYPNEKPIPIKNFKVDLVPNSGDSWLVGAGLSDYVDNDYGYSFSFLSPPTSREIKNSSTSQCEGKIKVSGKGKLRALVFGDSFYDGLDPFLSEHFSYVCHIGGQPEKQQLEKLVRSERPDIVIEERVERYLN